MSVYAQLRDVARLDSMMKEAGFWSMVGRGGGGVAAKAGRGLRGALFGSVLEKGPYAGKLMRPRGVAFNPKEWSTIPREQALTMRGGPLRGEVKVMTDPATGQLQYYKRKHRFGGLAGVVQANPMLSLLGGGLGYMYLTRAKEQERYAPAMDAAQGMG